jgi:hypothetical protein
MVQCSQSYHEQQRCVGRLNLYDDGPAAVGCHVGSSGPAVMTHWLVEVDC